MPVCILSQSLIHIIKIWMQNPQPEKVPLSYEQNIAQQQEKIVWQNEGQRKKMLHP